MYPGHKIKHHKHHKKHSSSSSSSSDSDDERKRYKKEQKKIKKMIKKGQLPPGYTGPLPGQLPPNYAYGAGMGMAGAAAGYGAGYAAGAYPRQPYPQGAAMPPGGYPTGQVPPPAGYHPPPGGQYPPPPGGQYPPAPGGQYPPGPPGQGAMYPPAGGYPAGGVPPPAGAGPFSGVPPQGYPGQPGAGYPPPQGAGYGSQPPPAGAAPFSQPPAGQPYPSQPGASQPGYPAQPPAQPPTGYPAQPPPGAAGYPSQPPAGYAAPPPAGSAGYPAQPPTGSAGYPAQPPAGSVGYPAQPPAGSAGYPAQPPAGATPGGAPPAGYAAQPYGGQQPQSTGYPAQPGGQPGAYPSAPPGAAGVHQVTSEFDKMKLYGTSDVFEGSVVPANFMSFSAEKDTEVIRKAMKGMGTDEKAIIDIIAHRSNQQRQDIERMFKTMYGKDLIKDLESELSGDFRETIMALFKPTTYYDAWSLHNAMMGLGTKDSVLIEVLCTRTNAEVREIVKSYKLHYHRDLEKDITDDTSGHYKRLLISCCQGNRNELTDAQWQVLFTKGAEGVVDRNQAREDANALYKAGEKKIGTDESTFLKIMAVRNYYQLRATFEEYAKIAGRDIAKSIDREMSGDLASGFKALIMSCRNRPEFFADKLYKALKGAGTDDSTLIRVVVSRSEVDLKNIKEVFMQKYGKSLANMVASDTSGDYKRLLLALIGQ